MWTVGNNFNLLLPRSSREHMLSKTCSIAENRRRIHNFVYFLRRMKRSFRNFFLLLRFKIDNTEGDFFIIAFFLLIENLVRFTRETL